MIWFIVVASVFTWNGWRQRPICHQVAVPVVYADGSVGEWIVTVCGGR